MTEVETKQEKHVKLIHEKAYSKYIEERLNDWLDPIPVDETRKKKSPNESNV